MTVQLLDSSGNVTTAGSGGLTLDLSTTSSGGTFLDTNGQPLASPHVTIAQGSSTASFKYKDTVAGAPTLTAAANGLNSGTQQETINAGTADHLALVTPGQVLPGVHFSVTVMAVDLSGNPTSASGSVTLSRATGPMGGKLVGKILTATLQNGQATLNGLWFNKAGDYTLQATNTASLPQAQSPTITVSPITHFSIRVPASAQAGVPFTFTVTARAGNGIDTGYQGTIHLSSNDPLVPVLDAPSLTFTAGVATVTATLKTAGSQRITAVDATKSSVKGSSGHILILAGDAHSFTVVGYPSSSRAGVVHTFTVTALDAYGNRATNYQGQVELLLNNVPGLLPDYTFTVGPPKAKDNGRHRFHVALSAGSNLTLTVRDTADNTITGSEQGITVT
jgi:hypothetical protein